MLTRSSRTYRAGYFAVTAATLAAAAGASAQIKYTLVAQTGDLAPGAGGAALSSVELGGGFPYHNNAGRLAFRANLTGAGVTSSTDGVVYGGQAGALGLVAREGSAAPGTDAGVVFSTIESAVQLGGASGAVAFRASISGPGVTFLNDTGLWTGTAGALELGARVGFWAPGTGSTFSSVGIPTVNGTGKLAFFGTIDEAVDNFGFWFGNIGSMTIIARQGGHADDFGTGVIYSTFITSSTAPSILLNSAGQVLYRGTVVGPGIGGANNAVMWAGTPGSMEAVAREGSTVSGGMSGPTWLGFEEPVLTDVGAVAFRGTIIGSGISAANDVGVWHGYILGVWTEVAREGDPAGVPGLPLGSTWSNLSGLGGMGVPKMNDTNQVAFRGQVSGGTITAANDIGIWAHNDIGALVLVAREGSPAPGATGGAVFTAFDAQSPVINNRGQVAYLATLSSGVQGLWSTDPYGVTHLVMLQFSPVTLAPGDTRTVTFIRPVVGRGVQDGTSTTFNDEGVLFIRADCGTSSVLVLADVNDQCRPVFTDQPDSQSVRPGETASFGVTTTGPGIHAYQWRRDGVNLTDGSWPGIGTISGATTAALEVSAAESSEAASYDCVVTNRCGSVTSDAALLTVRCPADYNGDEFVDGIDYDQFNNDFEAGNIAADFNGDGFVDGIDSDQFNNAFEQGC